MMVRQAGIALPTDRIHLALNALQVAGLASRRDFHDTLAACLLDGVEHRELFDQFQPRAAGIRAMLPQVDEFLPAHNLQSLAELAAVLGQRRRSVRA